MKRKMLYNLECYWKKTVESEMHKTLRNTKRNGTGRGKHVATNTKERSKQGSHKLL